MNSGIYVIRHSDSDRVYVGGSVNVTARRKVHLNSLRQGKHHSTKLQRAWDKYGEAKFTFLPIIWCGREDLMFYEQRAIEAFGAYASGFNCVPTAGSPHNPVFTKETREKMSRARAGRKPALGYRHTLADKEKMSASRLGRPIHPNTRAALDANRGAMRGKKHSREAIMKMIESRRGKKHSAEWIENIRIGVRSHFASNINPKILKRNK